METETKNTKAFYNTEIPSDWEVRELGQLFDFKNGINAGKESYGKGVKFINVMEVIYHDYIFPEMIPGTVQISEEQKELYLVKDGDVLFNRTSETVEEIGLSAVFNGNEEVVFGGFVIRGRPIVNEIDNLFKRYCLRSNIVRNQIIKGGQGAVRTNIGQGDLSQIKIPLPPLPEQKAIARVLSTWDDAIHKTEQLIAQKELRKKWLMQQLLTGKKRLKGFGGEWKEYQLGDLGDSYNGLTGKTKENFGSGFPFITYMNVFSNSRIDITQVDHVVIEENENQNTAKYGDFFFTVSSETPKEVGMASVLLDEVENLYLNSFCFGFRLFDFETLNPKYAQFLLRFQSFREAMCLLAQGSTRFNISKTGVKQILLSLPSIEEQTAIAQVLQAADKEISLLKAKAEKLREQKKGLMQLLLTGKKRLIL